MILDLLITYTCGIVSGICIMQIINVWRFFMNEPRSNQKKKEDIF